MTVKAIYEDGVFKPREPVALEEHAEVEIDIRTTAGVVDDDPTGWKTAERFIGLIKNAPSGVPIARDHDDYLD